MSGETFRGTSGSVWGSDYPSFSDIERQREQIEESGKVEEEKKDVPVVDIEELKASYPKGETESDEDYEKRIAGMKEAAEAGVSKTETITAEEEKTRADREAAGKLDKLFEERKTRLEEEVKERIERMVYITGDTASGEERQRAIDKINAKTEAKLNELRTEIDEAKRNGGAAELFEKLQNEEDLDKAFEESSYNEETKKIESDAAEFLKERYAERAAVEKEIEELEKQLDAMDSDKEKLQDAFTGDQTKAKEGLDKVLKAIDEEKNVPDEHRDELKKRAQERYEGRLKEIEAKNKEDSEGLKSKHDEVLKNLWDKRKEKDDINAAIDEYKKGANAAAKEVRERFNKTISTPEEAERYKKFFEDRFEENKENYARTGRTLANGGRPADEVVGSGIVGDGDTGDSKKDDATKQENVDGKAEVLDKEGIEKWYNKAKMELDKKYNAIMEELNRKHEEIMRELNGKVEEIMRKINSGEPLNDGSVVDDEPTEIDLGVDEYIKALDEVDDINKVENLEKVEEALKADLVKEEAEKIKQGGGKASDYISQIQFIEDVPVESYIKQMHETFADSGESDEAWASLDETLKTRYTNIMANKQSQGNSGTTSESNPLGTVVVNTGKREPLNINDEAVDNFLADIDGKIQTMNANVGKYKNARAFVRSLVLGNFEGISIETIMQKVIDPQFFPEGSRDDKANKAREKIMNKLRKVYGAYGLQGNGEKMNDEKSAKKRKRRMKIDAIKENLEA